MLPLALLHGWHERMCACIWCVCLLHSGSTNESGLIILDVKSNSFHNKTSQEIRFNLNSCEKQKLKNNNNVSTTSLVSGLVAKSFFIVFSRFSSDRDSLGSILSNCILSTIRNRKTGQCSTIVKIGKLVQMFQK